MTSITLSKRHRTPMSAQDMGRQTAAFTQHDQVQAALRTRTQQPTLHLRTSGNSPTETTDNNLQGSLLEAAPLPPAA